MKLYMHPVSMRSRPVRLFIAENKIPVEEVVIDLFTGEHMKSPTRISIRTASSR
jgi:glutathione S-transferase